MLSLVHSLPFAVVAFVKTRRQLAIEILALRHQLGVLRRSVKRPRLTDADRGLWVLLSRRWVSWSDARITVKPTTVVRWHRAGFRKYWTWRSRPKDGRPAIRTECLDHFVIFGERRLRYLVREFVARYHTERFHQGLGGQLVRPPPAPGNDNAEPVSGPGTIRCRSRLGGVLNFYHRDAA